MQRIVFLLPIFLIMYPINGLERVSKSTWNCSLTTSNNLDHSPWNKLLQKYVDHTGYVNYKDFTKDTIMLQHYLDYLAKYPPSTKETKPAKLAYYINLYNATTVKLILDNYPIKSIKDLRDPWAKKIISLGSERISLGYLEHKVLRKMNEPRIHFAINCASYSCPKLINKAFTPSNTEDLLEQATTDFINDPKRNLLSSKNASLSKIFNWYKKDFTKNGSLVDYINTYAKQKLGPDTKISYLNYNWALNEIE